MFNIYHNLFHDIMKCWLSIKYSQHCGRCIIKILIINHITLIEYLFTLTFLVLDGESKGFQLLYCQRFHNISQF